MKKLLLASLVILPLSACTSKTVYVTATTEKQKETITTDAPHQEELSQSDINDVYIATIDSEYPWVKDALGGRSELIQFGKLVCQAIDEGSTLADFALMAIDNDIDPEMLGFMMGAAVIAYCPENEWFINQYL